MKAELCQKYTPGRCMNWPVVLAKQDFAKTTSGKQDFEGQVATPFIIIGLCFFLDKLGIAIDRFLVP